MEILKFETKASDVIAENPNMMVPYYIMASYAYYVKDEPIFSDSFYDYLAKTILEVWDMIEHRHKSYLNKDTLMAGSYIGDYPSIIEGALESLKNEIQPRSRSRKRK
jgi:hypothetical protein